MKKILPFLLVAFVFGIGGYLLGGIRTGLKTAVDSDTASLMWITEINRVIQSGNSERANRLCFDAAKIHFDLLKRLEDHPSWMLINILPWLDIGNKPNEIILTKAKIFYAPRVMDLTPEGKAYLENIKEVSLPPSSCTRSQASNTPSPTP